MLRIWVLLGLRIVTHTSVIILTSYHQSSQGSISPWDFVINCFAYVGLAMVGLGAAEHHLLLYRRSSDWASTASYAPSFTAAELLNANHQADPKKTAVYLLATVFLAYAVSNGRSRATTASASPAVKIRDAFPRHPTPH